MLKARKFITAIALSSVLGNNVLADETVIISNDLNIHIPSAKYNSKNYWLDLRFSGRDAFGNLTWKMGNYGVNSDNSENSNQALSCQDAKEKNILNQDGNRGDGVYTIKLNNSSFNVYCDMTTDGGGWTYIANISDSDSDKWSDFYPKQDTRIWANLTTLGNNITIIKDYKSRAYNEVPATSLLIKEGERRNVLITEANCWIKQTFREFIASLTWNAEGSDQNWADNSGAYHCDYTDFGYNDPVLRASIQTNKKLLFKWGEKDGVQDQNKDRTMITTPNANNSNADVDLPTGLGGFTSYGVNMNYKDANECQADGPDQCSSYTKQNYQLFIR